MTPDRNVVEAACNDAPDDFRNILLEKAFSLLLQMDEKQIFNAILQAEKKV